MDETEDKSTGAAPSFAAGDVAAYFNADHAARYDRRIRQRCPTYEGLHRALGSSLVRLPQAAQVLVAGAGTGWEILTLGRRFPSWRFLAADLSAGMLDACRRRVAEAGMAPRVAYRCGDLRSFEATEEFDAATSVFVSHFILERADRLAFYRSVARSLKPGATFILADLFGSPGTSQFSLLFEAWLASLAEQGASAEDLVKERAHLGADIAFLPEAELLSLLDEAGFESPTRFFQTWLFGGWLMNKRSS